MNPLIVAASVEYLKILMSITHLAFRAIVL
jgi:hypothetical protein